MSFTTSDGVFFPLFFGRAWDASLEHHFQMSGSVSASHHNQRLLSRPFYSNPHLGRNPSQKEPWCQFLQQLQPHHSRTHVLLLFSSFLIIPTTWLRSAAWLRLHSLAFSWLNKLTTLVVFLSLLPCPPTHTQCEEPCSLGFCQESSEENIKKKNH